MMTPLVLALSAVTAMQQLPAATAISGQVRSAATMEPLPYAVVEVIVERRAIIRTQTDSNGYYLLRDVPIGKPLIIRAAHIDHAPLENGFTLYGLRPPLNFELEVRPVAIPYVAGRTAERGLRDTLAASSADLSAAAARAMETSPGVAELGLAEAVRDVPGRDPADPADVLYVRGGAADLKLVLLNGAPVYSPFHIGGLINALDGDVLRSATLYLGGAPARYDGGLSYVLDMETRSGRTSAPHGQLSLDMLASQANVEGPIGKRVAFIGSGRSVHGLGTGPFFPGSFPYGYADAIGRADIAIGRNAGVSVTGFWNHERVRLDDQALEGDAAWGNQAGSIRYVGLIRSTNMLLTLGSGHFRTQLPLGGLRPLLTVGISDRERFAADFDRMAGPVRLHFGGSHDRQTFEYRALSSLPGPDSLRVRSTGAGNVTGVYTEASFTALSRLRVRGGMRADVFSLSPAVRLAPRVSATLLLTDRAALSLAAGRYRQYVRAPNRSTIFLGSPVPDSTSGPPLAVAKSTHLAMALTQELLEGVRLGLEGYYKQYDNLPSENGERADASGIDIWLRRNAGSYRGWLGYSLGWVWSVDDPPGNTSRDFSGRQLVNAGVEGPLIAGGRFNVRVSYGSGLPYTAVPEPEATPPVFGVMQMVTAGGSTVSAADGEPADTYLRVDAEIARAWSGEYRGSHYTFMPYLRVINALDRRDALFYRFDQASNSAEPLGDLPILPIVGLEWRF
ncbi:MAG TPA: TonB-dependent receptor [Longimicrobiales bacterium]